MNKLLVPLEGSALAEGALAFATALSIPTAARLVLVRAATAHTFPGVDQREPQARALAEAEIYVRGVAGRLASRGFVVETATSYGERPSDWIVQEAKLRHADLIVMSTHGRTGPGRWVFGSVAEAVVAHSPVPVLVQRAWDASRRELLLGEHPRVLLALDGSPFAEAAVGVAAGLAEDLGAQLVLIQVLTTPHEVMVAEQDVARYFDAQVDGPTSEAEAYLQGVAERNYAEWPELDLDWRVEFGTPADGIAATASASEAALVVMATHGRTGLRRAALGSVAGRVLEHGHAPLVLVPPGAVHASSVQPTASGVMPPGYSPR